MLNIIIVFSILFQSDQNIRVNGQFIADINEIKPAATLAEQARTVVNAFQKVKKSKPYSKEELDNLRGRSTEPSESIVALYRYLKVSEDYLDMLKNAFDKGSFSDSYGVVEYTATLRRRGKAFEIAGLLPKAIQEYKIMQSIADDTYREIIACQQIAKLSVMMNDYETAIEYLDSALANPYFFHLTHIWSLTTHLQILEYRFTIAYLLGDADNSKLYFEDFFGKLSSIGFVPNNIKKKYLQYRYLFENGLVTPNQNDITVEMFENYLDSGSNNFNEAYDNYLILNCIDGEAIEDEGNAIMKSRILQNN